MNYKKIFLLLVLPILAIANQCLAIDYVQNAYSRSLISLDGQWNRIIDPYENGYYNHRYQPHTDGYFKNAKVSSPSELLEYNFATADKIKVPGDWNSQDEKLFLYEGTLWYHKDFSLSKRENKRYVLHFGAVNYQAIVYVNGVKVGDHEGGFTSFQFDITDNLNPGKNFVVVKVNNRRERNQIPTVNTDWWNYGGITRPVAILEVPVTYVADYTLQLSSTDPAMIKASVKLAGSFASKAADVVVSIPELNIKQAIAINREGIGSFSMPANPILWSPEDPKLYDVEIAFNGETIKDRIGFRIVAVRGENIELNGKSIFLRGISIHEESPLSPGRAWSEDHARTSLRWAKELGCNFVRLAHYPHNEAMLKIADEMGLLVWSEIPVYWTVMFDDKFVYAKAEKQLTEMIIRDKNRASIILWSVANETPVNKVRLDFLSSLIKKTRKLDASRLVTAAMDTQSSSEKGKVIDDPLASLVDVIGVNSYCGWYSEKPENCGDLRWQSKYNKPIIMSEFGAGALQGRHGDKTERWTEEYQAEVYMHNIAMLEKITALRGVTPWILKDFRSPRRSLADIQDFFNRKGLISETGIRKQAWYVLHDYYQKKAAVNH
ncbi:MAG: glycoside hydrolase family 2 TIM barrel-domain containing protein [Pseudomonadota bacterium]